MVANFRHAALCHNLTCQSSVDYNYFLLYVDGMIKAADLKRARERAGESQEEFAKRFGVGRTTLLNWETRGPPKIGPGRAHITRVLADLAVERANQ